jgi:hypothetical protein
MDWDQVAKGCMQLIVKIAFPHSAGQEIDSEADHSIRAALSGGDRYDEAPMTPYVPDTHGERDDFSLHLSC